MDPKWYLGQVTRGQAEGRLLGINKVRYLTKSKFITKSKWTTSKPILFYMGTGIEDAPN